MYRGVQHVFVETSIAEAQGFRLSSNWNSPPLSSVPDSIREAAPTRVHILEPSLFFGPVSTFMRMLQKLFGIESDVTLDFESITLSVPINLGFAMTSLSLAHIYAISTTDSKGEAGVSIPPSAPILTANLVVESTNFVKKYNELVHNFKSKRSLSIVTSSESAKQSRNGFAHQHSRQSQQHEGSPHTSYHQQIDDASSVKSTHSAPSVASSSWSHYAVRDAASVAVASDIESLACEDFETTRRFSRAGILSSSNFVESPTKRIALNHQFSSSGGYPRYSMSPSRSPQQTALHRSHLEDDDETESLNVSSLEPAASQLSVAGTISSSSSSPLSFSLPMDIMSSEPHTPPPSLSRKRPRVSLSHATTSSCTPPDDFELEDVSTKRPFRASDVPSANSSRHSTTPP